jgi:hypothetical protein
MLIKGSDRYIRIPFLLITLIAILSTPEISFSQTGGSPGSFQFPSTTFDVSEGGIITITVTRTSGNVGAASVRYRTTDGGTATPGADYIGVDDTISFASGETVKTFTISTLEDNLPEGNETVVVILSNPTNDATLGVNTTILTINDNDVAQPGRLQLSASRYVANEDSGFITITVTRTNGSNVPVSINYGTSNGTATVGLDYANTLGMLSFDTGVISRSFNILIFNDSIDEPNETVNIFLTGLVGGASLGTSEAVLTIIDDEVSAQPILNVDSSISFGSVNIGETETRTATITNIGGATLTVAAPTLTSGAGSGFSIASLPLTSMLTSGQSTTFLVNFRPASTSAGQLIGSISINSNGGSVSVELSGRGIDTIRPTVDLLSLGGGETITAGMPVVIRFNGSDNDAISNFLLSYSTDGGNSFPNDIARVGGSANQVTWNLPDNLQTTQGRVRVTATDRAGNISSAMSGIFTVQNPFIPAPGSRPVPALEVVLTFDPPVNPGVPPGNLIARAREVQIGRSALNASEDTSPSESDHGSEIRPAQVPDILGYNIYRVTQPAPGQPLPTPDQIANNPSNLVGSLPAVSTMFVDVVSSTRGDNFLYSITAVSRNGSQSPGSNIASTDLPVIRDPRFTRGTLFLISAGASVKQGAQLIVNDAIIFPLQVDSTGTILTVDREARGTPGNIPIKTLIRKGRTVKLNVRNLDGKLSLSLFFTR